MARDRAARSRRQFVQGGLALAGLGLLSSCGVVSPQAPQPTKVVRLGHLEAFRPGPRYQEALREGLREHGYVEGQNLIIESRFSDGSLDPLPELAAELVRLDVDVIVGGGPVARIARAATATIPIVSLGIVDPVGVGVAESLARPGGNVTGLGTVGPQLTVKRLDLLKAVVPGAARVAVIWNPRPAMELQFREAEIAARAMNVQLLSLPIYSRDDVQPALEAARSQRPDAFLDIGGFLGFEPARVRDFVARTRLPTVWGGRGWVDNGGLMSYGVNDVELARRAGSYVDKILKGTKPGEIPIELPTTFELVINLKTAQALGLTIPKSVIELATEVIE